MHNFLREAAHTWHTHIITDKATLSYNLHTVVVVVVIA